MLEVHPRIVESARSSIKGFDIVYNKLSQWVILEDKSMSTLNNYMRRIASLSLHFKRLPENISDEEINGYLANLAISSNSPSRTSFKHTVYGLRYYFRHAGFKNRNINLPIIQRDKKLPVIFNRSELKQLFCEPSNLKQRVVLTFAYSAGLRSRELINMKISDIDFERKTVHIRKSKYKKDRVVPLSNYICKGLKLYLNQYRPINWLFNGKNPDGKYSARGLSWILRESLKRTNIQKQASFHTLRHSYATHLLEEGVNIVQIKELLGHSNIMTTMIYLHVAQNVTTISVHSPLDTLYSYVSKSIDGNK